MTSEFEEKLEEIIAKHDRWIHGASERALNILDTYDAIKQLFLDTLLKAIGEDEEILERNLGRPTNEEVRNKLRSDIKAKVYEELGIKGK